MSGKDYWNDVKGRKVLAWTLQVGTSGCAPKCSLDNYVIFLIAVIFLSLFKDGYK